MNFIYVRKNKLIKLGYYEEHTNQINFWPCYTHEFVTYLVAISKILFGRYFEGYKFYLRLVNLVLMRSFDVVEEGGDIPENAPTVLAFWARQNIVYIKT